MHKVSIKHIYLHRNNISVYKKTGKKDEKEHYGISISKKEGNHSHLTKTERPTLQYCREAVGEGVCSEEKGRS